MATLKDFNDATRNILTFGAIGALGFGAYEVWKFLQGLKKDPTKAPTVAATIAYWAPGFFPPGTQIPDTTKSTLSNALVGGVPLAAAGLATDAYVAHEEAKAVADAGPHTKYAYDRALSHYAANHGYQNGAAAAASDGWPYTPSDTDPTDLGFADWAAQGFPDLSTIS